MLRRFSMSVKRGGARKSEAEKAHPKNLTASKIGKSACLCLYTILRPPVVSRATASPLGHVKSCPTPTIQKYMRFRPWPLNGRVDTLSQMSKIVGLDFARAKEIRMLPIERSLSRSSFDKKSACGNGLRAGNGNSQQPHREKLSGGSFDKKSALEKRTPRGARKFATFPSRKKLGQQLRQKISSTPRTACKSVAVTRPAEQKLFAKSR